MIVRKSNKISAKIKLRVGSNSLRAGCAGGWSGIPAIIFEVRAMSSGDVGVQYRAVFFPTENQLTFLRMDGKYSLMMASSEISVWFQGFTPVLELYSDARSR